MKQKEMKVVIEQGLVHTDASDFIEINESLYVKDDKRIYTEASSTKEDMTREFINLGRVDTCYKIRIEHYKNGEYIYRIYKLFMNPYGQIYSECISEAKTLSENDHNSFCLYSDKVEELEKLGYIKTTPSRIQCSFPLDYTYDIDNPLHYRIDNIVYAKDKPSFLSNNKNDLYCTAWIEVDTVELSYICTTYSLHDRTIHIIRKNKNSKTKVVLYTENSHYYEKYIKKIKNKGLKGYSFKTV